MPREQLNRNAYLSRTSGRKHGHLHADQLAEAGTSTGERAAAETQNYAAQEVPEAASRGPPTTGVAATHWSHA